MSASGSVVVVVGQGYVGLPLALAAVAAGHDVVGLEPDPARAGALATARSYVDDVSDAQLAHALATGRYRPTPSYDGLGAFDVAVLTVPTPLRERCPDLSFVEAAARSLAPHVRPGALVVLESTTWPGTTETVLVPLLEQGSGLRAGTDFHVGYSPERIDPGNDRWTLATTPKVVSGVDAGSAAAVAAFYDSVVASVVPVSSTRAAEMTKLLENTFRHVNIALVNELAVFAHEMDIDVWEVVEAAATKPFGFMRFTPGPGVGGHCLPIDPAYLSWRVQQVTGRSFRFVEVANDVNEHMPDYVVHRITLGLNERSRAVRGSRVLLLGRAYKRNSGDARESPSTRVVELLAGLGADVVAVDPHVVPHPDDAVRTEVELTAELVRDADAVVLLTDHDKFDYDVVLREAAWVLDCRHRLTGPTVESL